MMTGKKTKKEKNNKNREFSVITYLFLILFMAVMGYMIWFLAVKSEDFINNPYNKRIDSFSEQVTRGKIVSADGTVLAETLTDEQGNEVRNYPYSNEYAHVVGFNSNGKSGLESTANFYLLRSHEFFLEKIVNDFQDEKDIGDTAVTTLNTTLQDAAYQALGNYDGAVVVLEPSTGKILAMVSKPDFDPNHISEEWDSMIADTENSSLLNRASQGLYPPGSTFKIFTTLEYIRENPDYNNFTFDCNGRITIGGVQINCYHNKNHGTENLSEAFANSCNSAYASLGTTLDIGQFKELCNSMLFNQTIETDIPVSASRFSLEEGADTAEIMETAIGQGSTLVTPLHMAMTAAAIDQGGTVMKPYLLDRIENNKGVGVKSFSSEQLGTIMTSEEAALLKEYMAKVVTDGTGSALLNRGYTAYGKTGSAEYNEKGDSHAWFVGFASMEGKTDIALAVILEGAGAGSSYAVPAAGQILDAWRDSF